MTARRICLITLAAAILTALAGCTGLDVVGKDSVRAFGEVMEALPAQEYEQNHWALTAPDGTAWFAFDDTGASMVVDAAPFAAAGADLSKLENVGEHTLNPGGDSLLFSLPAFDTFNQSAKDTALTQFEYDIGRLREYLGYHGGMDHYNIGFGGGDMFEWAKDTGENDKDVVFVLDPAPLIDAGLDPNAVEGWVFAKVAMHLDGKTTEVDKLLKAFDLN